MSAHYAGPLLYDVSVRGCDASTYVTVDLTPEQALLVGDLAERITKASESGCEPTMSIVPHLCDSDCPEDHA